MPGLLSKGLSALKNIEHSSNMENRQSPTKEVYLFVLFYKDIRFFIKSIFLEVQPDIGASRFHDFTSFEPLVPRPEKQVLFVSNPCPYLVTHDLEEQYSHGMVSTRLCLAP